LAGVSGSSTGDGVSACRWLTDFRYELSLWSKYASHGAGYAAGGGKETS
jgi:hypothetical protein